MAGFKRMKRPSASTSKPKVRKPNAARTKEILDSNLTSKQKYKLLKGQDKAYTQDIKQAGKTARRRESAAVKKSATRGAATTGSVGAATRTSTDGGDSNVYYIQNGGIGEDGTSGTGIDEEQNPYGSGKTYGN